MLDVKQVDKSLVAEAWTSPYLYPNLETLCSFGSRFAGTAGEIQARDFIADKFRSFGLTNVILEPFEYLGWSRGSSSLRVSTPVQGAFPAISLVYSPSTPEGGMRAPLVDVGMGTEKDYARLGSSIAGQIVLCSSANPTEGRAPHRREKYGWAVSAGAAGFVYMRHLPGGLPETGSLRAGRLGEIPAVAVSYETGHALRRLTKKGEVVVELDVQNQAQPAVSSHVMGDVSGQVGESILVGAHYDGHDISLGAIDNASGVTVLLELARLFAPFQGRLHKTIRFMAFACEELGVLGSTRYVDMHREEMKEIGMVINLDAAVGEGLKGFSYSGLDDVRAGLEEIARETGYALSLGETVMTHSDHFPFFMAGVPAIIFRAKEESAALGRGFGHTEMDTPDKVSERELRESTMVTARVLLRLAGQEHSIGRHRTPAELAQILIDQHLDGPLRAQGKWPFGPP